MEVLNCQRSNEQPTEAAASGEMCRLRHGLNVNCLLKVFEYLDLNDLMQVCKVNVYFKELIMKWTIKDKVLDLKLFWCKKVVWEDVVEEEDNNHEEDEFSVSGDGITEDELREISANQNAEDEDEDEDEENEAEEYECEEDECEEDEYEEYEAEEDDDEKDDYEEDYVDDIDVFKTFGKSIRKFKITTNSFTLFLKTITKYCEPAMFTEVYLTINHEWPVAVDLNVLQLSMPLFSHLRRLTINYSDLFVTTAFLTEISKTASNLQILELVSVDIKGGWLKNMQNLRELRIQFNFHARFADLTSCWMVNPKLKAFQFVGFQDITKVADVLTKYCPDLKEFGDINFQHPQGKPRRKPGDNRGFDVAIINRYNFLSTFTHLNSVTLTSYYTCSCDLYYPLKALATKNIVKLKLFMENCRPFVLSAEEKMQIIRRSLPQFNGLKTVEFFFHDFQPIDLRCQFLLHFVSQ